MNPTKLAAVALVLATAAATLIAGPARADTIAQENPPVLIAQDTTPAPATIPATVVGIDANVVGGLSVTGHGGKRVTATAKGQRTRAITAPANRPAVLRNLTPGVRYTVAIAGRRIGTAVPLAQVGAASGLKVETTSIPGTVLITWSHATSAGEGADIAFDVTATPINADGTDGPNVVTVTATGTSATLESLVTTTRYRFTVTPRNSASTGRTSSATMTRTLADLSRTQTPRVPEPVAPAPSPAAPAAAPAAPTPAPAAPSVKTVWVCPTGYTENVGVCRKTLAYTFTYAPYTFHQVTTGPAPLLNSYETAVAACPGGYNFEDYGWVKYCRLYGAAPTATVKDPIPAGATDDGTQWVTKDPAPAGYSDDGSQWVATTAKVPVQVPA